MCGERNGFLTETQILVHGAKHNMTRFKSKLLSLNASKEHKTKVFTPGNCEELRIPFVKDKIVKVVGRLARQQQPPKPGEESAVISGVLVRNEEHSMSLMDPADLPEYAGLPITRVGERVHINLGIGPELIRYGLSGFFGYIEELPNPSSSTDATDANGEIKTASTSDAKINGENAADDSEKQLIRQKQNGAAALSPPHPEVEDRGQITTFCILNTVLVYCKPGGQVELSWEGNLTSDSIADATLAAITGIAMSPAGVRFSEQNRQANGTPNHHHQANGAGDEGTIEQKIKAKFGGPGERRHPFAEPSAGQTLARLCALLEAQFGEENLAPIKVPRRFFDSETMSAFGGSASSAASSAAASAALGKLKIEDGDGDIASMSNGFREEFEVELTPGEKKLLERRDVQEELARLHSQGILIPGFEVRCDRHVARVWLEDLTVECEGSKVWRDRVQVVVKNALGVCS